MASLARPPAFLAVNVPSVPCEYLRVQRSQTLLFRFPSVRTKLRIVCCTNASPWEPAPVKYVPADDSEGEFLKGTTNIFETMKSTSSKPDVVSQKSNEDLTDAVDEPLAQFQPLTWPMWLIGPAVLLLTGMVPTLWLPISSIFLGPNIASLLSLTGLDCIFNLGATLFLLMADSCARPKSPNQAFGSKPPSTYRFWNMAANISGFIIPLMMLFVSQRGFFQPQLTFIPSAILLGPYFLLLSVQILTELLTWHWQSPIWLVTPVIYEAYRVLQLMRGLKLGAELSAPSWMVHTIRGLVCWWILVLGMQLMRVAWFAGFTAHAREGKSLSTEAY